MLVNFARIVHELEFFVVSIIAFRLRLLLVTSQIILLLPGLLRLHNHGGGRLVVIVQIFIIWGSEGAILWQFIDAGVHLRTRLNTLLLSLHLLLLLLLFLILSGVTRQF